MSYFVSDRGFRHYDPISTGYGHEVRVYESSAAMEPHVWLVVTLTSEGARKAHTNIKPCSASAHLTLDQARAVRGALDAAIANHYLLR